MRGHCWPRVGHAGLGVGDNATHHCSQPGAVTPAQAELLGPLLDGVAVTEGRGCEACQYTGYRGRIGLYELLVAKIAAGVTTVSELVRVVPYRHIVAARNERGDQ